MNKSTICGLILLLGAATAAVGQASLPTFYSGPWGGANILPTGWTKSGLGTDYATDYDSSGGTAAKFDSSGDFLQIYFNSSPSTVSYFTQGNGLSGAYTYKIQESSNGSTWTDVVTYDGANPIPGTVTGRTNNLLSTSRYVKFIYVTKVLGNVGLDGVRIVGPGVPSVSFNPSGNQSIAASNELALAVSITPSGSGMKSWTFLPSNYAGVATLSNSTFRFTPAVADVGNVYALAVVGSNSVGSTTGTVNVTVTAYVAPVPVIAFSPAAPYNIMASQTQRLGIAVSPAGSGIGSWTFLPSSYAGSATLVGTNFTFVSDEADGPASYTLSVVATNIHGATTGTASIAVSAYVPPPPPGAYFIDFESTPKPNYPATNVTIGGKSWELAEALIGNLAGDQRFDGFSLRMRYSTTLPCGMTSQTKLITNGVGTISLWYAAYGGSGYSDVTLAIEISESLTAGWTELDSFGTMGVTNLTYRSVDVYVSTPVYVRIRAKRGVSENRANVDNITITDYSPPSMSLYDAFLLKYNVTPGDPGTAPGDDYDGDGFSNTNEFVGDKNPYDPAIHP